jgi:hypothetical protein
MRAFSPVRLRRLLAGHILGPMPSFSGIVERMTRRVGIATVSAIAVAAPAVAWAQRAVAPPAPSLKRATAPWVGYLIIFVLLALVLAVSLWPSKRGHQD